MSNWILSDRASAHSVVEQKLRLVSTHDLKEALPFLLNIARGDPTLPHLQAKHRGIAILTMAKLDPEGPLTELEPLLADDSPCYQFVTQRADGGGRRSMTVQLRDIALIALLHRTGQDPKEYGFQSAKEDDQWLFKLGSLGFESDEQRGEALQKWDQWRAEQGPAPDKAALAQ